MIQKAPPPPGARFSWVPPRPAPETARVRTARPGRATGHVRRLRRPPAPVAGWRRSPPSAVSLPRRADRTHRFGLGQGPWVHGHGSWLMGFAPPVPAMLPPRKARPQRAIGAQTPNPFPDPGRRPDRPISLGRQTPSSSNSTSTPPVPLRQADSRTAIANLLDDRLLSRSSASARVKSRAPARPLGGPAPLETGKPAAQAAAFPPRGLPRSSSVVREEPGLDVPSRPSSENRSPPLGRPRKTPPGTHIPRTVVSPARPRRRRPSSHHRPFVGRGRAPPHRSAAADWESTSGRPKDRGQRARNNE